MQEEYRTLIHLFIFFSICFHSVSPYTSQLSEYTLHIIVLSCCVLEITIPDNFTMVNLGYLLFTGCFLGL